MRTIFGVKVHTEHNNEIKKDARTAPIIKSVMCFESSD